jgi:2-C-methyl-D-erythritol 2,4-cyclodiphosphate synthase
MGRVGLGYDSHRFVSGRPLVLGGVWIEHDRGLVGHSDADAVLHALIDALLGAVALGDIGEHFPDTDARWKDADSAAMLAQAMALVQAAGYRVANCDVTIITELPKLARHKAAMRKRIAELLAVSEDAVSVKAKTNEGMGWIGQGEGLAVIAAAAVEKSGC